MGTLSKALSSCDVGSKAPTPLDFTSIELLCQSETPLESTILLTLPTNFTGVELLEKIIEFALAGTTADGFHLSNLNVNECFLLPLK